MTDGLTPWPGAAGTVIECCEIAWGGGWLHLIVEMSMRDTVFKGMK